MIDYLYIGLYRFFTLIVHYLPKSIIKKIIYSLAYIIYILSSKQRKRIHSHLELAYPDTYTQKQKQKIGIASLRNLLDTVFGILNREGMSKEKLLNNIVFEGSEILESYQQNNKQFILITGHYGNWELLSQAIAVRFQLPLVGVGRQLDSVAIDKLLKKNREQFDVEMIYKKGAMKECIKAIKQGKIVGILTDQAIAKQSSIDVNFFAQTASHTPLASILSRKFDLDLIPAYISTDNYENYKVTIYPPIKSIHTENQEEDLAILTQLQADAIELTIRKNPKQWFWMHRRWK